MIFAVLIALGATTLTTQETTAQVNVNINIGSQPAWGPVGHNYVQYYYIPEYNIYYDVLTNRYVYLNNRRWIHAAMLPPHLRHIDLYRTHKVVINQHNPFRYNHRHIRDYGHYRSHRGQMVLRDDRNYHQYRGGHNRPPVHQPRLESARAPRVNHQPNRPPARHQAPQQQRRNDRIAQQHRPAPQRAPQQHRQQRPPQHRQGHQRPAQHRQAPNRGGHQRSQGAPRSNQQHERGGRR